MSFKKFYANLKGMTILETVIAMAIIASSSLVLYGGVTTALNLLKSAKALTEQSDLARANLSAAQNNQPGSECSVVLFDGETAMNNADSPDGKFMALKYKSAGSSDTVYTAYLPLGSGVVKDDRDIFVSAYESFKSASSFDGAEIDSRSNIGSVSGKNGSKYFNYVLKYEYGCDSDLMLWRMVKSDDTTYYNAAFTDIRGSDSVLNLRDGDYIQVTRCSTKKDSSGSFADPAGTGYCQVRQNGTYLILETLQNSGTVEKDTFFTDGVFTKDTFITQKNADTVKACFKYFLIDNHFRGCVSWDNCSESVKSFMENQAGIDENTLWTFDFNEGTPKFIIGKKAPKNEVLADNFACAYVFTLNGGEFIAEDSYVWVSQEDGKLYLNGNRTVASDVFEKNGAFADAAGEKDTVKALFESAVVDYHFDKSIYSGDESVDSEVKNAVKDKTGITVWQCVRKDNEFRFTYTDKASVTESEFVKAVYASFNYESGKWEFIPQSLCRVIKDGDVLKLSQKRISGDLTDDNTAAILSSAALAYSDYGEGDLHGEAGAIDTSSKAYGVIKFASDNYGVDLSQYLWKLTDGKELMLIKKDLVPKDSDGGYALISEFEIIKYSLDDISAAKVKTHLYAGSYNSNQAYMLAG